MSASKRRLAGSTGCAARRDGEGAESLFDCIVARKNEPSLSLVCRSIEEERAFSSFRRGPSSPLRAHEPTAPADRKTKEATYAMAKSFCLSKQRAWFRSALSRVRTKKGKGEKSQFCCDSGSELFSPTSTFFSFFSLELQKTIEWPRRSPRPSRPSGRQGSRPRRRPRSSLRRGGCSKWSRGAKALLGKRVPMQRRQSHHRSPSPRSCALWAKI